MIFSLYAIELSSLNQQACALRWPDRLPLAAFMLTSRRFGTGAGRAIFAGTELVSIVVTIAARGLQDGKLDRDGCCYRRSRCIARPRDRASDQRARCDLGRGGEAYPHLSQQGVAYGFGPHPRLDARGRHERAS